MSLSDEKRINELTGNLAETSGRLEASQSELSDMKLVAHELELRVKELEGEKQMLSAHVEKLNQELNGASMSLQSKKEFGEEEIRGLLDEHKGEKDEWEKIRESRLIRPVL